MTDPIALFLPVFTPNLTSIVDAPPPALMSGTMEMELEAPEASEAFDLDEIADAEDAPAMTMPETDGLDEDFAAPVEDEAARIAQAREEALAEAAIATEAALAALTADLESRHAEALAEAIAEERRRWVEQEGATMAEQLRNGLEAVEKILAEGVVEILQPVLERAIRAQAAEELRQAVTQILATPDAPLIRIGGPADLVEPLRNAFSAEAAIEIVASESPEVTVEAGDSTIRTQLQNWANTLSGHLGEAN